MDNLIRITRDITFNELKTGRKKPIDVYEEQMEEWLFKPLEQLSKNKENHFEFGYAMLALELLFFEPHGKYLSGNSINGNRETFNFGFKPYMEYLSEKKLIDDQVKEKIYKENFYNISRCGIYHSMTIGSGLLIDSIFLEDSKVFYPSPIKNGVLVNPWNFLDALKDYTRDYVKDIRSNEDSDKCKNFMKTFTGLFIY
jgi:hypothetical protein